MLTTVTQDAKARQSAQKPWLPRDRKLLGGALLIAALVAAAYCRVLAKLVTDWWQIADFSHGFLVPPFAAYVLWRKRDRLLATGIAPSWSGVALVFFGLLVLLLGVYGSELFLYRI
jgi:hypothetical protein